MKYATLAAVLLAVMQAAPPVPRQAPNSTARSGQNVTKNAKANQGPSKVPPALQNSAPPEPNQHGSQTPTDANAKETIVVREPTPMPKPRKDWWDRAYVIFTGLLVLVGIAASLLARHTLNAIRQHSLER
jgi:cell division septation protein DedD